MSLRKIGYRWKIRNKLFFGHFLCTPKCNTQSIIKRNLDIATYFSKGDPPKQCPVDFPYAFNYGNACCYYDKDGQGNRINTRSLNCYSNTYRFCSEDRCLDNSKISYSYTRS